MKMYATYEVVVRDRTGEVVSVREVKHTGAVTIEDIKTYAILNDVDEIEVRIKRVELVDDDDTVISRIESLEDR